MAGRFRKAARRIVEDFYEREVDKYLIKPRPTLGPVPDPFLPSTLADWEPGDPMSDIDWRASILSRGAMAGAMPLRRQKIKDEPIEIAKGITSCEIYLDTSGSMTPPSQGLNPMTLAAQVLAASCIRTGGRVRGVVWSAGDEIVEREWTSIEKKARRFFLNFIGGGTVFPWELMRELSEDRGPARGALRVVVSDDDIAHNYQDQRVHSLLQDVARRSELIVFVLALGRNPGPEIKKGYESIDPKVRVVVVKGHQDLVGAIKGLGDELFRP